MITLVAGMAEIASSLFVAEVGRIGAVAKAWSLFVAEAGRTGVVANAWSLFVAEAGRTGAVVVGCGENPDSVISKRKLLDAVNL
jgi:hypothetical protein